VDWCRKCKVEYTVPTKKCFHCNGDTIPRAERMKELEELVEVYKKEKLRREEKKDKWSKWKKTKAMLWKKTATDYSKWEYFTDSENELEEIEKKLPPITPKDDPGFRALEKDMEERNNRNKIAHKEAMEKKNKANNYMKKKDYHNAI